jgi:hypothetical protein
VRKSCSCGYAVATSLECARPRSRQPVLAQSHRICQVLCYDPLVDGLHLGEQRFAEVDASHLGKYYRTDHYVSEFILEASLIEFLTLSTPL